MAIVGMIVHGIREQMPELRLALEAEDALSIQGEHEGQYLVVVAELHSDGLEDYIESLESLPGAIGVYPTYVNVEDELENEAP